jgi:3-methylcrotonyl-CoA carboxylase alpha subunit
MFDKILIANRGEIACRVIATCRRLGIATVAVFSEADATALHVALADEAIPIGPAQASLSYLNIEAIIAAAKTTHAQAIHPGYGFLSENPDFADACKAANIVLIGPPAASMRAMGSKAAAKSLMAKSGVPLVPGYHGDDQSPAILAAEARKIGLPVLIKASAGGGGRGMRIVETESDLADAIQSAAREARASFNDGRLLIEKYLTQPRHIEIQIFCDAHGNAVSLFERDCSIQRRHQKVIEEAPAPFMDPARRTAMGQSAIAAAQAVGYVGAGTVEFIAEGNDFYFMEMNTRLQVEHPATEKITGLDLVEWQLRVAAGERLPLLQPDLKITGHAIEVRIYAEDPARQFLPSIGRLTHLRTPAETPNVRVDTGFREGDTITPYYDAMIAKLIVHGEDRPTALRHLRTALAAYEVAGVQTNLALLRAIAAHPDFAAAHLDTGFIARHPALLAPPPPPDAPIWAAAILAARQSRTPQPAPADPHSPWTATDSWRPNTQGRETLILRHAETTSTIHLRPHPDGTIQADLPTGPVHLRQGRAGAPQTFTLNNTPYTLRVLATPPQILVIHQGANHAFTLIDPLAPPAAAQAAGGKLTAPIPARVTRILVAVNDTVQAGAPLVVLEAMKMELTISAPAHGTITALPHAVGDMVQEGTELVAFTPSAPP